MATSSPIKSEAVIKTASRGDAPEQATGEPDTAYATDSSTAWTPQEMDAGLEWLQVSFEKSVPIAEVRIRESYNPGAISKVSAILPDGSEVVLWEGRSPVSEAPCDLVVRPEVSVEAKTIKICLDTARVPGWNEIDAIALIGTDGSKQWAASAKASSSYGSGRFRIRNRQRAGRAAWQRRKPVPGGKRHPVGQASPEWSRVSRRGNRVESDEKNGLRQSSEAPVCRASTRTQARCNGCAEVNMRSASRRNISPQYEISSLEYGELYEPSDFVVRHRGNDSAVGARVRRPANQHQFFTLRSEPCVETGPPLHDLYRRHCARAEIPNSFTS